MCDAVLVTTKVARETVMWKLRNGPDISHLNTKSDCPETIGTVLQGNRESMWQGCNRLARLSGRSSSLPSRCGTKILVRGDKTYSTEFGPKTDRTRLAVDAS
jgi:hypothetical protein